MYAISAPAHRPGEWWEDDRELKCPLLTPVLVLSTVPAPVQQEHLELVLNSGAQQMVIGESHLAQVTSVTLVTRPIPSEYPGQY